MGMIKNKKGIFFILIVIVIVSLFAISFIVYESFQDRESVQTRVATMNAYLFSVEKDLSRHAYISGFRGILIVEKKILETGTFSQNVSQSLNELFFNGTLAGESQEIMIGATYTDIQNAINANSAKLNVEVNLSSPALYVIQTDSWNLKVILQVDLKMTDRRGLASWSKTETASAIIPISNFEDPLYAIKTGGLITNNITKTPFTIFAQGSNLTNLTIHALNSYYKESTTAPSFLNRLEGKLSLSPQGIESLVNLQKLSDQGLEIESKSVVDYIYFSSDNPSSAHIEGMPEWFRLDDVHIPSYNLS
jgi:hypothetical protein